MNSETKSSRFRIGSKISSIFLSAAILATTFTGLGSAIAPAVSNDVFAAGDYGLCDNIQDGNILHCFCWKYSDVQAMLPEIAAAGFTSVQVSPSQATAGTGAWWWFYQPLGFYIGSNAMGDKNSLRSLCAEADKYGIKVIADVVANHLAGDHSNIQDDLKDGQYWHEGDYNADDGDRYRVTHGRIGMPDLNTEHSHVQECVANYVQELKSVGVDGIRFDAAKHIGLPSEGDNFWPTVTADKSLWYYGEILNNPGLSFKDQRDQAIAVMKEYSNYIGITDSPYGMTLREAFNSHQAPSAYGNYCAEWMGLPNSRLVYWAESHDTWANNHEWGYSNEMDQNVIDRAYAIAASRNGIVGLYLSRPYSKSKDDIHIGDKGSTHFTSKEVAAVNHFKNAMNGSPDYFVSTSEAAAVCRAGGVVVVLGSGGNRDVTVPNGGGTVTPGTYVDEISGSTFTVTADSITGHVGDTGIAVAYNKGSSPIPPDPSGSITLSPSSGSFTDTMTVSVSASGVTDVTYSTSNGESGSVSGTSVTFGSSASEGSSVTLTVKGKKSNGEEVTATGTYSKKSHSDPTSVTISAKAPWNAVYAYVYDDSGATVREMAKWPGTKMQGSGGTYTLDVSGYENGKAIFSDGVDGTSNRYPADQQPGLAIGGKSMLYNSDGNTWTEVDNPTPPQKLSVSLSASPTSVKVGQSITLTATPSNASGTVSYTFKADSEEITASGATATYTAKAAGTIRFNVTATDSSGSATASASVTVTSGGDIDDGDLVTVDKASGTSFDTETMALTISTSANVASGTYSVDNGPQKSLSSNASKSITIGEGKIGDSTVAVKVSVKDKSGNSKAYTFTYEKKYKVKTTSSSAASTCDKYKTNPGGNVGAQKTITSASDFTSETLVAQGIANDDPGAFKGLHEAPKFDLYALYAAWDDTNLYVGIQYTNVTDVIAPEQEAPQTGRGKPNGADADIPQMLLFDLKTGDYTDGKTNDADQKTVWNSNVTFGGDTKVDKVMMYSPKEGIDNFAIFPVTNGLIDYSKDKAITPGYQKPLEGASVKWEDGFFGSSMNGINDNGYKGYKPADIESSSSNWVDFLTTGHSKTQDTFCIVTIPLKYLGVSASDISSKGIGLMAVTTYGSSGVGCLPNDTCMLDNAMEAYSKDDSTSGEKEDVDLITVPLAGVGKGGSTPTPPTPIPDPDPDPDTTPLQVNFGADRSAPQLTTTNLTLKGIGMGGTAPYKYAFYVDGTQVQASSTTATYSWTPSTAKKHTIKCVITDSKGNTATESKYFTAEGQSQQEEDSTLTNNSTVSATSITLGKSVTLKGAASGGTSPYKYTYMYKLSSYQYYRTFKSESTATSASYTPTEAGTYYMKVKVTDAKGASKEKSFVVKVSSSGSTTALTNKSTLSAYTVAYGSSITVKGAALGGTSPYKYAVYYKKSSASYFTKLKDFSTTANVTFKPASPTVYNIRVYVQDAKSTKKYKDMNLTVTNSSTTTLKNNSKVNATSVTLGKYVVFTGSATGGKSPYTYAAYYKTSSATYFTKLRDFASTATVNFKPKAAGTYTVRMYVKDSKGTKAYKDFTIKCTKASASLANASTLSATTVTAGKAVAINCKATGGTAPYTYAVYTKKSTYTNYTLLRNYSSATKAAYRPSAAGTYNIRVYVKDAKGTKAYKDLTLKATAAASTLKNTSKTNVTTVEAGKVVTITASATGGTKPYQFAVYIKKSTAKYFQTLRAFSTGTTIYFRPSSAGKYTVRVKVKDAKNNVSTKDITITATAPALVNNSKISATTVQKGKVLTITGAASGGTAPYQYAVYTKKSTATYPETLRAYSTGTTIYFRPASVGTYTVTVKVKDNAGKVVSKSFTVKATAPALVNKTTISATAITLGKSVTITGAAAGGTSPYQYAVYYKKSSATTYTQAKAYSTTKTATIKPAAATTYNVRTKVKDKTGKVVNKDFTVKVTAPLTNKSTLSASSVTLGKTVTIKCAATGGKSPYKYAIYYKKSSASTYTTLRDFSTTATAAFKPAAATTYNLKIKVKDASGEIVSKVLNVKAIKALKNTSKVSATSVTLGKSITVTGAATGGVTPYKYAYFYKKSSASTFTTIKGYSTSTTATFKPAVATSYVVRVKVKDKRGIVATKDITVKAVKPLANTSTISATSIKLGKSVTVTCAATGGKSSYKYNVCFKKASATAYTTAQAYSTNKTVTIKPTAATSYNVRVMVKDAAGTVKKKFFTLKVTK